MCVCVCVTAPPIVTASTDLFGGRRRPQVGGVALRLRLHLLELGEHVARRRRRRKLVFAGDVRLPDHLSPEGVRGE